jgi:ABC-type nitrate/sulfonate/bicarbonate transport system permease component
MLAARRRIVLNVVGVVGLLAIWEAAAAGGLVNTILLSSPTRIVGAAGVELRSGVFWTNLAISLQEYLLGMLLSIVVGTGIGLAIGLFRRVYYFADRWLTVLNSTPLIALAPMIIIILGIDLAAKVAVIFIFAVFPVAINTLAGVHATSNRYLRVSRSFMASQSKTLTTVIIPGALPYIVTGLRVASGRAIIGVVVAEFMAASSGIGYQLNVASSMLRTSTMMFLIIVIGLLGVVTTFVLKQVEVRVERWRPAAAR